MCACGSFMQGWSLSRFISGNRTIKFLLLLLCGSTLTGFAQHANAVTLCVTDAMGNFIWKVYEDGSKSAFVTAGLVVPTGIVSGNDGNYYVVNTMASNISKITAAGEVSTFASIGGNCCYIVQDPSGNLYANVDLTIKKITPSGIVSDFASGFESNVGLLPITCDSAGNIYCNDVVNGSSNLYKITPSGEKTLFLSETFLGALTYGGGYIYAISNTASNYEIAKISTEGVVTTFSTLPFDNENILTLSYVAGDLYTTTDAGNIYKTTSAGESSLFLSDFLSYGISGEATVPEPATIALLVAGGVALLRRKFKK